MHRRSNKISVCRGVNYRTYLEELLLEWVQNYILYFITTSMTNASTGYLEAKIKYYY